METISITYVYVKFKLLIVVNNYCTNSIVAKQSREIRSFKRVHNINKLGAKHGIHHCKYTTRKQAVLQELGDGFILRHLHIPRIEPHVFFL